MKTKLGQQLAGDTDELSPAEKAVILDGQALQLRGTSLRLKGDLAQATDALKQADSKLQAVRDGRVESVAWMRRRSSEISPQSPKTRKIWPKPTSSNQEGVILLEANYPGSAALLNAKARLAGYPLPHRPSGDRRGDVPRDRSLSAGHEQPSAYPSPMSFGPTSTFYSRKATIRRLRRRFSRRRS